MIRRPEVPLLNVLLLAACCAGSLPQEDPADPLPPIDAAITRSELEHHVRFLASDELGGRSPGTAGMDRAARYLARALEAAGLAPGGEDGGWFQETGLERYEYPTLPRLLLFDPSGTTVELESGRDFSLVVRGTARSTEKLGLRFFYDYNHARMPLQGNPAEALYFCAAKVDKERVLAEKGIPDLQDWGLEIEVFGGDEGFKPGESKPVLPPRVVLPSAVPPAGVEPCELVRLRGEVRADFDRFKFTHVQLLVEEVRQPYADRNVVGILRGAGTSEHPELGQEVVLLTAHYDHLGRLTEPRKKDRDDLVYNGADDDASGCAALLELAQAFAAGPPPVRTLVFLFTTGEELENLGAARYLAAPAAPLERTVAVLNLEMLGRPDALAGGAGRLWLTGYERSTLGPLWQERGLPIASDPRPQKKQFEGWAHYPFALEGPVAQSLSSYADHRDRHQRSDEADTLDYGHLEGAARLAWQAAGLLADGSLRPAWLEGLQPKKRPVVAPRGARTPEEREARRAQRKGEGSGAKADEDGEGDG